MNEILIAILGGGTLGVVGKALFDYLASRRKSFVDEKGVEVAEEETSISGYKSLTRMMSALLKEERQERQTSLRRLNKEWEGRLEQAEQECIRQMNELAREMQRRISKLEEQVVQMGGTPNG